MAHRSDGPASSLGCLGMCTEQCAVVDVNSKCWRNMFLLDVCLHTRQMRQTRRVLEPEGVGGASESVGGSRRALENADEGRCCWPSALVQVPDQPRPSALIQVPDHPWPSALILVPDQSWLSALIPVPDQPCWEAPLSVLSKELGVLPVRATSRPPGV